MSFKIVHAVKSNSLNKLTKPKKVEINLYCLILQLLFTLIYMTDRIKDDLFYDNSDRLFLAHPDNNMISYNITKRPKITDDNIIIGYYFELDNNNEDDNEYNTLQEAFNELIIQINNYYDNHDSYFINERINGLEYFCGKQNLDLYKKFKNMCLYKDFIDIDSLNIDYLNSNVVHDIFNSRVLIISTIDDEILSLFKESNNIISDNLIICSFNTTKYILNKFIFEELNNLLQKNKKIKYNLIDLIKSSKNIMKDSGKLQSKKENTCYEKLKIIYDDLIKQYKVPATNYHCDFYSQKNNLIIEFLGDYFHGNLQTFNASDLNPTIKKTHKVLNEETCNKLKNIKDLKYNVCYIWENKYDTLKNNNIQTIIDIYKYEEII